MALKAAENFKNNNSIQYGDLKTVIYACEESTRFSQACLGSAYLSGGLQYDKIATLEDKNGISFEDAIAEYKGYIFSHLREYGIDLNNIELVDKILNPEEVTEAIESHIEQSEILFDSNVAIGGIDSIGKPLRGNINVHGPTSIITASKIVNDFTNFAVNSKNDNPEETIRVTVPKFNSCPQKEDEEEGNVKVINSDDDSLIAVDIYGKSNHSGATPMDARKDAVLGLAKLVLKLDELQEQNPNLHFEFLSSSTPKWGANQIQDKASLIMKVDPAMASGIVNSFAEELSEEGIAEFDLSSISYARIKKDLSTDLFVDIRQQYPVKGAQTRDNAFDILKKMQEKHNSGKDSVGFYITSIGNPVKTSTELLENVQAICAEKNYPCQVIHSWPGHDLACILPESNKSGKRILFFIPSQGGSHNPDEKTSKEAINIGTDVYTTLVSQRMNKFKEEYLKKQEQER